MAREIIGFYIPAALGFAYAAWVWYSDISDVIRYLANA